MFEQDASDSPYFIVHLSWREVRRQMVRSNRVATYLQLGHGWDRVYWWCTGGCLEVHRCGVSASRDLRLPPANGRTPQGWTPDRWTTIKAINPLMQLADKSAHRTCQLGKDGWQIGPHDLTIVLWMADKLAELIIHARQEWPIKQPQDYQPWKNEKKCLSTLGLVHTDRNWVSWFSALNILYIHLPCTLDRRGTKKQIPRNSSAKKSLYQTATMTKKSVPGEGM